MAWLRIDDGFPEHPKVIALRDDKTRWILMRILCHCARYRTDGHIAQATLAHLGATRTQITNLIDNGILDLKDNELHVHDWRDFNPKDPTAAQRKQRERSRTSHANVTPDVTPNVTDETVTQTVTSHETNRDETVTRAQPRARVPVPSRPVTTKTLPHSTSTPDPEGVTESSTDEPQPTLPPLASILKEMPA